MSVSYAGRRVRQPGPRLVPERARPQPLLTAREAAERLHVSDSTLRRLRRSGAITDIWIGRRSLRFDPVAIDAYIAGGTGARGAATSDRWRRPFTPVQAWAIGHGHE